MKITSKKLSWFVFYCRMLILHDYNVENICRLQIYFDSSILQVVKMYFPFLFT